MKVGSSSLSPGGLAATVWFIATVYCNLSVTIIMYGLNWVPRWFLNNVDWAVLIFEVICGKSLFYREVAFRCTDTRPRPHLGSGGLRGVLGVLWDVSGGFMCVCLGGFRLLWGPCSAMTNLGQFQPVWANMGQFWPTLATLPTTQRPPRAQIWPKPCISVTKGHLYVNSDANQTDFKYQNLPVQTTSKSSRIPLLSENKCCHRQITIHSCYESHCTYGTDFPGW